jgi:hypothetical protein
VSRAVFVFPRFFESLLRSQTASVAILPSALFYERFFARCELGVLESRIRRQMRLLEDCAGSLEARNATFTGPLWTRGTAALRCE